MSLKYASPSHLAPPLPHVLHAPLLTGAPPRLLTPQAASAIKVEDAEEQMARLVSNKCDIISDLINDYNHPNFPHHFQLINPNP